MKTNIMRAASLVVGAAFAAVGIYRDEAVEIMIKAVRICLECIGIG